MRRYTYLALATLALAPLALAIPSPATPVVTPSGAVVATGITTPEQEFLVGGLVPWQSVLLEVRHADGSPLDLSAMTAQILNLATTAPTADLGSSGRPLDFPLFDPFDPVPGHVESYLVAPDGALVADALADADGTVLLTGLPPAVAIAVQLYTGTGGNTGDN